MRRAEALRAAGVASFLLAGVAPAAASGSAANGPPQNLGAPVALSEEEIADVSLLTFGVDKVTVGSLHDLTKFAYCRGCGSCRRCRSCSG
jgi:hypothetical protein